MRQMSIDVLLGRVLAPQERRVHGSHYCMRSHTIRHRAMSHAIQSTMVLRRSAASCNSKLNGPAHIWCCLSLRWEVVGRDQIGAALPTRNKYWPVVTVRRTMHGRTAEHTIGLLLHAIVSGASDVSVQKVLAAEA